MPAKPILICGAGATKACGGPLTNEILPDALALKQELEREGFVELLERFLVENFHLPPDASLRRHDDYPPLPLLLSLLDIAIDRKHPFGPQWDPNELVHVRDALEYAVFALLEHRLRSLKHNYYSDASLLLWPDQTLEPAVISLNYDIIADNTLVRMSDGRFPFYGCDIATPFYKQSPRFGRLLKLHGSLNWLYCPGCHRLDLGISQSGRETIKALEMLYLENPLEQRYSCHGSPCADCASSVRPVMITPTHQKDYRNPHIAQVWYHAERALREADRAFIVGYSMPEDDVDVIYLLKKGLAHLDPTKITVVEFDKEHRPLREHPVGVRYRSLFGDRIDWCTEGLANWIAEYKRLGLSPLTDRLPPHGG